VQAAVVEARWTKVMNSTDAQHPPRARSNPTGNLRLARARQRIDHRTWFRRELFATCDWRARPDKAGNATETTLVAMDVAVRGAALGPLDLEIDHAPHRVAGQGNVPTVLHWGPVLGPMLRAADLTGSTIAIERLASGRFRLSIA
jgi:hypothetical protein